MATPFTLVNGLNQEKNIVKATVTWTPAASSHTALDSVGGARTFTISGGTARIIRLLAYNFTMATTTPVTSAYKVFFFDSTPTVIADDAAFVVAAADGAKLMGYVDIAQPLDFTSTWQEIDTILAQSKPMLLVTDTVTAYLQNATTATYEAVAHKLDMYFETQL